MAMIWPFTGKQVVLGDWYQPVGTGAAHEIHVPLGLIGPRTSVHVPHGPISFGAAQNWQLVQFSAGVLLWDSYSKVSLVSISPSLRPDRSLQGSTASAAAWMELWGFAAISSAFSPAPQPDSRYPVPATAQPARHQVPARLMNSRLLILSPDMAPSFRWVSRPMMPEYDSTGNLRGRGS